MPVDAQSNVPLTFLALSKRIDELPTYDVGTPKRSRRARISFAAAVITCFLTFLVPYTPGPPARREFISQILVAMEVIAILVVLWNARVEIAALSRPVEDFARALDHDFSHFTDLREWLASQPVEHIEKYATMAKFRRDRLMQKLPLLAGNIPTLGIIPVVVALYYQVREVLAGRHLSLVDAVFGTMLVGVYLMTWTMSTVKLRVDAMDMYLQQGLADATKRAEASKSAVSPPEIEANLA